MDYQSSLAFLESLTNFELTLPHLTQKDFSLDRFRRFLSLIGDPHTRLTCVHIAGSKGKGSTAVLTAQMLKAAGYRVGLYTSPHLYDVRERVRVLSDSLPERSFDPFAGCISKQKFASLLSSLHKIITSDPQYAVTYFECLTALAFLYFDQQKTDIVVLETGLGGRLDSTNVVHPLACGITRIDLEHTHILGNTLSKIALEKAGIIKPGCRQIVLAEQPAQAKTAVLNHCRDCGVPVVCVGDEIVVSDVVYADHGLNFSVACAEGRYAFRSQMLGNFQAMNTAVAVGLIGALNRSGFFVDKSAVEEAVAHAVWPARMEVVCNDPLVVVDGAHTIESSRLAADSLCQHFPGRAVILIFGMSGDKDWSGVAENFAAVAQTVVFTRSKHRRAGLLDGEEIDQIFLKHGVEILRAVDSAEAVEMAVRKAAGETMIFAAGSIFLAAEVRQHFYECRALRSDDETLR